MAPTFSGGYSLSGPLAGVEVARSVRTPKATYRIPPAGAGLHAVSEVDLSRLPPLAEPISGPRWEQAERPPIGPDGGLPTPVEPPLAPPLPAALRAIWDAPRAVVQGSIATDRAALEALYDKTGGPNSTDSTNCTTDAPPGKWFAVTTDSAGRVRWLYLPSNALTGALPTELGNLPNLQTLALDFNELSGPTLNKLKRLVNLRYLSLIYNSLTGPISSTLGRLGSLETLYLNDNELTARLSAWLGNLDQLRRLSPMQPADRWFDSRRAVDSGEP